MYKWYQKADLCYVYLADFSLEDDQEAAGTQFARSRWFTRGWTLQELLAPDHVIFYDRDWIKLGSKTFLKQIISETTGISPNHLRQPRGAGVATKMSWASYRETSREEDMAYSLLGLFDINMPLIYGEGKNAFFRLQSEIIRTTSDESIYAWTDGTLERSGLLAQGPWNFKDSGDILPIIRPSSMSRRPPLAMTSRGLTIEIMDPHNLLQHAEYTVLNVPLNCAKAAQIEFPLKLHLKSWGQIASRIHVDQIEFYQEKVPEYDKNIKYSLLYVENRNVENKSMWPIKSRWYELGYTGPSLFVKFTSAPQSQLVILRYVTSAKGPVELLNDGEIRLSPYGGFSSLEIVIWFQHFPSSAEFIIGWKQDGIKMHPRIRIYNSSSIYRSPLLAEAWENSSPTDIFDRLPPPTSLLSEPHDSTALPLGNGKFLWIDTQLQEHVSPHLYNVHIDVTSIDRSRLLTKAN